MFFFFNDTSTTEIYTYLHTLALHDALPICGISLVARIHDQYPGLPCMMLSGHMLDHYVRLAFKAGARGYALKDNSTGILEGIRSEEHTSELQSLMRISYDVFCLKKKKYKKKHI